MSHQENVITQIHEELGRLAMTYDSRTLAAAMMVQAASMLRGLRAAGMWKDADVQAVVEGAVEIALGEVGEAPKVVMIDEAGPIEGALQ
jgi:hypothetical protein